MNIVLRHFVLSEMYLINTMFPDLDQFLPAGFVILILFYFEKPTSLLKGKGKVIHITGPVWPFHDRGTRRG